MALDTYSALKVSVAGWMNVSASDLSSQIDDVVTLGESRIYRECRSRDGEKSYATAIASGVLDGHDTRFVVVVFGISENEK